MKLYNLYSYIYLDKLIQQYRKIITINKIPDGPLQQYVKYIKNEKRSIFEVDTLNRNNCLYAIINPITKDYLDIEDISELFEFLINNDYIIDNQINKIMYKNKNLNKEFICSIKIE